MDDNEIIKAFEILDKFEFFGGRRAGRELWFNKPTDIQDKDIGAFLRDLDFLKQFINRQKAELERLERHTELYHELKAEAQKEFAERLKNIYLNDKRYDRPNPHTLLIKLFDNIDNLLMEMEKNDE